MQHTMSVTTYDSNTGDVWYVDSRVSNHMTHHKNWFNEVHAPEKPSYVKIGDDTLHSIEHVGKVPLSMHDGKTKHMADVLHVPTITKNLVFVGPGIAGEVQQTWLFCRRLPIRLQVSSKREKNWKNVHIGCEHANQECCVVYKQECSNF